MLHAIQQSRAIMKIPVHLITGFLGSGKTTLLNALLKHPNFGDSAVVVNEFGEIGLDHLLVSSARENIVLLDSGCLCCAVLDSLPETLLDLFARRTRAELPAFGRVFIETTGLADPLPILRTLMKNPMVSHFYAVAGVICVVDVVVGLATLDRHAEGQAQVAVADRILLSKTDRLEGSIPDGLQQRIRLLNPTAPVLHTGAFDLPLLFAESDDPSHHSWLTLENTAARQQLSPHEGDLGSISLFLAEPVSWAGIGAWTAFLTRRLGPALLRCKGILNVEGHPGPVVLHGVQGVFDLERRPAWPDGERRSRLVLIGRSLPIEELRQSVEMLHAERGIQQLR